MLGSGPLSGCRYISPDLQIGVWNNVKRSEMGLHPCRLAPAPDAVSILRQPAIGHQFSTGGPASSCGTEGDSWYFHRGTLAANSHAMHEPDRSDGSHRTRWIHLGGATKKGFTPRAQPAIAPPSRSKGAMGWSLGLTTSALVTEDLRKEGRPVWDRSLVCYPVSTWMLVLLQDSY